MYNPMIRHVYNLQWSPPISLVSFWQKFNFFFESVLNVFSEQIFPLSLDENPGTPQDFLVYL